MSDRSGAGQGAADPESATCLLVETTRRAVYRECMQAMQETLRMPTCLLHNIVAYLPWPTDAYYDQLEEARAQYNRAHPDEPCNEYDSWFCFFCLAYLFTDMGGDIPYVECEGAEHFFCEACMAQLTSEPNFGLDSSGVLSAEQCPVCREDAFCDM